MDEEKMQIKSIAFLISCSLSVICTGLFLIFFLRYGKLKDNFASQLILVLAISDLICWAQCFITILYVLISGTPANEFNEGICIYIGYIVNLSALVILITVFLISFSIYLSTVKNICITKYQVRIWLISAGIALILSFLPFIFSAYGPVDSVLCWVVSKQVKFYSYYFLILLIFFIDYFCIVRALAVINRLPLQYQVKVKLRRHLIFFPLVFIFSFSAGLINSIISVLLPDLDIFWLEVLDYILEPLDGILNPIAYMLINEKMMKGIRRFFGMKVEKSDSDENLINSEEDKQVKLAAKDSDCTTP